MKRAETIRVLLVDDHQTMLWGLEKLIQGEAPRMEVVETAKSAEEAVEKSSRLIPDVILLDLDLNGKSSLDCLPTLLSNNVSRVLVLTAERRQSILESAIVRGARGVLHKDTEAEQVLKAIEKVHQGELWINQEMLGRVLCKFTNQEKTSAMDPEKGKIASLTAREKKIIDTVVRESGAPNKVIAQRLFISEHTLRNHLTSIYQKLGVGNRLELYVYAIKHALTTPGAARQALPDQYAQDGRRQPSHAF